MVRLIPVREELERGDYRALYLGWLCGVDNDCAAEGLEHVAEDETEPLVPEGLGSLTAAQRALAEFLGLDEDLLTAAAAASPPAPDRTERAPEMERWVAGIPVDEDRKYLLLLLQGKGKQAEAQLRHRYAAYRRSQVSPGEATLVPPRSVAELEQLAGQARARRQEQEERKRQAELAERRRQRERHLTTLAKDFDRQWKHAHSLAEGRTAATYDQALACSSTCVTPMRSGNKVQSSGGSSASSAPLRSPQRPDAPSGRRRSHREQLGPNTVPRLCSTLARIPPVMVR